MRIRLKRTILSIAISNLNKIMVARFSQVSVPVIAFFSSESIKARDLGATVTVTVTDTIWLQLIRPTSDIDQLVVSLYRCCTEYLLHF